MKEGFAYYSILCKTGSNMKGSKEHLEKSNQPQNPNVTPSEQKKSQHPSGNPVKNYVLEQLAKLMTTCIIIRIDDFTLYKVTTTSRNPMPKEFISGIVCLTRFELFVIRFFIEIVASSLTIIILFGNCTAQTRKKHSPGTN